MAECPECRLGAIRRRAHRRQPEATKPGGELSVDLSGPHLPGRWPSDSPESVSRRAQYFLVASYRVFTDVEVAEAQGNEAFAKKKARRVHFEDEEQYAQSVVPSGAGSTADDTVYATEDAGRGERTMYFVRFLETKHVRETLPALQSIVTEVECHFK